MKGIFVRPSYGHVYNLFKLGIPDIIYPPLGYMYLASFLEAYGHNIAILDGEVERLDENQIVNKVLEFDPDFVGIGATTPEFAGGSIILRKIKELAPHIITITGGPHPSALPKETLKENPHIDYVVINEGEQTLLKLLDILEDGGDINSIEGLTYRENGTIVHNKNHKPIPNLDELPFPARHLIDIKKYTHPVQGKKGRALFTTMITSRGCPYRCIFCYRSKERSKTRFRSPTNVADEIEEIVHRYNIRFIIFNDDTMTLHNKRVHQLCDEIINRGLDIHWYCLARADTLNRELLLKMKKAGMVNISMGIESGNQKILDSVKKEITLEQCRAACKLATSLGIETRGSFILGLPHETPETIRDTINFAKSLDLTKAFFNIATPYPGSVLYDMALQGDGLHLLTRDWKDFKRWGNAVIELNEVSRQELIRWQRRAMIEFYLRPKILWHHLKHFIKEGHDTFYYKPQPLKYLRSIFSRQK